MNVQPALECKGVTKSFGDGRGVFDVSITVERGSGFALLGHNGSGKTTLINICLGYIHPDRGTVFICGRKIDEEPIAAKMRIAYVPEVARLYSHLNAYDHFRFYDDVMGHGHRQTAYDEVIRKLDLPTAAMSEPTRTYSKGMRQKVTIALGLLKEAEIFLLDEPTSGLDRTSATEFARIVRDLKAEGRSILFSTHDCASARTLADNGVVLREGRIVASGAASELASRWNDAPGV